MKTAPNDAPSVPGLILGGLLGEGSHTRVYAATRQIDGWECAVKVHDGSDPHAVRRAWREAALSGSLRLPHLVRIHEVIETSAHAPALILDRVCGGHLGHVLQQRGHLSAGETVTILAPVLSTLASLHDHGIVHGDLSARNILLDDSGRPFVTDLGGARVVGEHLDDVLGTPGFSAPELTAGAQPSAASDVFAAGALAWLCLTGTSAAAGLVRPALSTVAPDVPDALAEVVELMLRADAIERPTAADAQQAFLRAARPEPLVREGSPAPADALTYRLRAHLKDDAADEPESETANARGAGESHGQRGRPRRGGHHRVTTHARGRAGLPSKRRLATVILAGGVLVLGVGDMLGGSAGWSGVWGAITAVEGSPAEGSVQSQGAPVDGSPETPSSTLASTPTVDVTSAADVMTAFQRLVATRAAAYRAADPAILSTVYAPGAAELATEQASVQRLGASAVTYQGLSYRVRELAVLAVSDQSATVRATVDTSDYVVQRRGASPAQRPATSGQPMTVRLERVAGQWRLSQLTTG